MMPITSCPKSMLMQIDDVKDDKMSPLTWMENVSKSDKENAEGVITLFGIKRQFICDKIGEPSEIQNFYLEPRVRSYKIVKPGEKISNLVSDSVNPKIPIYLPMKCIMLLWNSPLWNPLIYGSKEWEEMENTAIGMVYVNKKDLEKLEKSEITSDVGTIEIILQ